MSRLAALATVGLWCLAGCATAPDAAGPIPIAAEKVPAPRPDWATELTLLLPAIRACLDRSAQATVGVTKAWTIADNLTGVRLLAPGGERLDCVAEATSGDVLLTEKVWTVSQLPGEREPLYTPTSQARPASSPCLSVSVARDGDGGDVGWLSYDVCRSPRPAAEADLPARPRAGGGNS